jgi:hypothetical protein
MNRFIAGEEHYAQLSTELQMVARRTPRITSSPAVSSKSAPRKNDNSLSLATGVSDNGLGEERDALSCGSGAGEENAGLQQSRYPCRFFINALMATVIAFSLEMQTFLGVEHHAD